MMSPCQLGDPAPTSAPRAARRPAHHRPCARAGPAGATPGFSSASSWSRPAPSSGPASWAVPTTRSACGRPATPSTPGSPSVPADLVRREVRFAGQGEADAYLTADVSVPEGATLARAVGAGELLPRAALGDAGTGSLTEVPLSVDSESVPASLRVGAVVDVWVTPDAAVTDADPSGDAGSAPRSVLVFDDVPVLSVPRTSTSLGPTATRQVIVGVDEDQQPRLPTSLAALAGGTVVLTAQR